MALRTVGVRLAAEVSGYINNLRTAKRATTDFVGELNRAAKAGNLDAVADQARNMGLALTAGFGAIIAAGARFDKQMSAVRSATLASAEEMERLRQAALAAGADTAFSATEAAQGIEELAKAGVSTSDILRGGLRGALDLAAAGGIDVAEAAETAASAMTQFRLSGSQVPHVADLLAAAAGKAQGGVRDLSYALSQSGLVASQVGLTIEETTAALAAFASAGLLGSDAGTSFKTMLQRLVAPSGEAARKMQELGIRAFDAQGKFVGLEKFAGNLQRALAGLTDEQRNAALATIFGSDAIRAATVIYQQGEQGIRDWIKAVDDQGFAAETAAAQTDNLIGDIERLTGSLETLAIESSTGASAGLRTIVQAADNVVQSISQIPAPVQTAAVGIAGVAGAALLAGSAAIKMRESVARAAEQLTALGPLGERTARGLNRITVAAGRVGVALAVMQVASAAFGEGLDPKINALASSLEEFAASGKVAGETARIFGDDMVHLHDALKSLDTGVWSDIERGFAATIEGLTGLGSVMDDSLQKSQERLRAIDQALTQLVAEGKADEAAEAFNRIAAEGAKFGISVNELSKGLPNYTAAVEEANKAGDIAARVQAEAKVQAKLLAGGWEEAAKAADGLRAAHEQLAGELLESIDAEIAWREAIDRANEEIPKLVRNLRSHKDAVTADRTALDLNTKAGREVARMLRDLTDETINATQAKFDETKSVEAARKVYEEGRKALIDSMKQAGLTREAAEKLAEQWLKMPKVVGTEVRAPGLDPTLNKARELVKLLSNAPQSVSRWSSVVGQVIPFAHGGIHDPASGVVRAQHGLITDRPMVLFGERGTGREAFIPRDGISRQRGLELLSVAARWHGAAVVPWEQQAPAVTVAPQVRVFIGDRELTDIVRVEIRDHDRGLRQRVRAGVGRR